MAWHPVHAQELEKLPRINGFAVDSSAETRVYAATQGGLFVSSDGGKNWTDPYNFKYPVTMAEISSDGNIYAFVVTKGLLRLGVSDKEWLLINNKFGGQVLTKLAAIPGTPVQFLAQNQYGKVLRSYDGGETWAGSIGGAGPVSEKEKRGEKLFATNCQSCHGIDGVGEAYSKEALTTKGYLMAPALDDSTHAWHHTDDALVKTIMEGSERTERMKAWKNDLKETDARDIVAYMKSLWGPRALECQGPKHMKCM
mgnify:CR=1 FL=1